MSDASTSAPPPQGNAVAAVPLKEVNADQFIRGIVNANNDGNPSVLSKQETHDALVPHMQKAYHDIPQVRQAVDELRSALSCGTFDLPRDPNAEAIIEESVNRNFNAVLYGMKTGSDHIGLLDKEAHNRKKVEELSSLNGEVVDALKSNKDLIAKLPDRMEYLSIDDYCGMLDAARSNPVHSAPASALSTSAGIAR